MAEAPTPAPTLTVTAHVWRLRRRHWAFGLTQAAARPVLERRTGARFARLLGTGKGDRFTLRDAQLDTWALIEAWDDPASARAFDASAFARRWARRSIESGSLLLDPLSSRGTWSGERPFGNRHARGRAADATSKPWRGPVAAVTRARIRPRRIAMFWRAVPPVAQALRDAPGCRLAIGIGEAPLGWQGTLSVWDSAEAMERFAYRDAAHAAVVARTATAHWYAEELFARFAVLAAEGSICGRSLAPVTGGRE